MLVIQSKNDLLKQSDNTIQGYDQMFTELLLEMKEKLQQAEDG